MTKHKPILTDAEMHALICGNLLPVGLSLDRLESFARNVERYVLKKLAEQEPVAWHTEDHLSDKPATTYDPEVVARWEYKGRPITPLYAHPGPDLEPDYYFYKGKLHCNDGGTHLNHGAKEYGRPPYDRSMPNSQGFLDSSEPKERPTIRCNDCWWHGNEDGLVLAVAKDYPDDEPAKVCPNCKKLGCLMDLDDSNHIPNASKMLTPLAHRKIQSKLAEGYRKIESATVLVNEHGRAAIVNHGGAFYWVENSALAREYDGRPIPVNSCRPTETNKKGVNE